MADSLMQVSPKEVLSLTSLCILVARAYCVVIVQFSNVVKNIISYYWDIDFSL